MFTGLIQGIGKVERTDKKGQDLRLILQAASFFKGVQKGDSVAVNGCCLTAVEVKPSLASFEVVPETLGRTTLGRLKKGDRVNLELPLKTSSFLGGHFVQGHIDGTALVTAVKNEGGGKRLTIKAPARLLAFMVEKGSLSLEGVSLTLAALKGGLAQVALVPHTLKNTTLGDKKIGDRLNLEVDLLAKHLAKLATPYGKEKGYFYRQDAKGAKKAKRKKTG